MLINGLITLMLIFSAEKPAVSVLCYHAFREGADIYSFSIDELKGQIEYFKGRGYKFVTYSDIIGGKIQGRKNILVTIDDGNKTVYAAYNEVFKPNGIKPIIAIYPAVIGKQKYALTWEQVRGLSDAGCVIAAHGYNHLYVNRKLHDSNFESFKREIYYSKKVLEEKLGKRMEIFIYPYGVRSEVTKEHLLKAGYSHAFTADHGQVEPPFSPSDNYELPRYIVTRPKWKNIFAVIDKNSSGAVQGRDAASVKKNPPKMAAVAAEKKQSEGEKAPVKNAVKDKKSGSEEIKSAVKDQKIADKNDKTEKEAAAVSANEKKSEIKQEHSEEIKKIYYHLTDDSYKKYGSFNEMMNKKLKNSGAEFGKLFDLNRENKGR